MLFGWLSRICIAVLVRQVFAFAIFFSCCVEHVFAQRPVDPAVQASGKPVNCGVASFSLGLQAFGMEEGPGSKEKVSRLESAPSISALELCELFEGEGLSVNTFLLGPTTGSFLATSLQRLQQGSCCAVILVPTGTDARADKLSPGHFLVVKRCNSEGIETVDPQSGQLISFDFDRIRAAEAPALIQFVYRPYDRFLYAPIRFLDLVASAILITMVAGVPHAWKAVLIRFRRGALRNLAILRRRNRRNAFPAS